jgi:hypothetical protein
MIQKRLTQQGRELPRRVTLIALLFLGGVSASAAQNEACPRELAIKAESEASTLKTWQSVFTSYQKYKQCDDGGIAEGHSSSVATLLADHWEDVGQLIKLNHENPSFGRFVLRHVDETMSLDQARIIKKNIAQNCPAVAKEFCVEIHRQFESEGI